MDVWVVLCLVFNSLVMQTPEKYRTFIHSEGWASTDFSYLFFKSVSQKNLLSKLGIGHMRTVTNTFWNCDCFKVRTSWPWDMCRRSHACLGDLSCVRVSVHCGMDLVKALWTLEPGDFLLIIIIFFSLEFVQEMDSPVFIAQFSHLYKSCQNI